jgi:hypothetical protein
LPASLESKYRALYWFAVATRRPQPKLSKPPPPEPFTHCWTSYASPAPELNVSLKVLYSAVTVSSGQEALGEETSKACAPALHGVDA